MKQLEIAELIVKGLKSDNVYESERGFFYYIKTRFYACALGLAVVGKYGSASGANSVIKQAKKLHYENSDSPFDYIAFSADLLGIDVKLAQAIDDNHLRSISAQAIAQKLKKGLVSL